MDAPLQDCQICLEPMSEGDNIYPVLCPEKCGFNFCLSCVEHLVESSEHDYQEASDGSLHVKVKLQCPQCRGSLVNTIRDTLLMRKAFIAQAYMDVPDSELNATELRIKHEFVQDYATEVEHAQARLRKFQRDHHHGEIQKSLTLTTSASEEEVSTFKDEAFFGGMEYAMSNAEQSFVTKLMISGDPDRLAQAAQILHGIMQISMQGITPSTKKAQTAASKSAEMRRVALLARFRKTHPLPARMPKYTILTVFNDKKPKLTFKDDEWDGSIADAYSRVHTQKRNMAVDRILSTAESEFCGQASSRVKIKTVKGEAGRVGLQKGDVVTHINAEPWTGTAEELSQRIYAMYEEDPNQTFSIVVNAEPATAQALKLRGQACRLVMKDDV